MLRVWQEVKSPIPDCKAFLSEGMSVIVGIENGKWHMSIAHLNRYPMWDEIREARYKFVPDNVTMAMLLPPKSEYVNLHTNCFHLHQIED